MNKIAERKDIDEMNLTEKRLRYIELMVCQYKFGLSIEQEYQLMKLELILPKVKNNFGR